LAELITNGRCWIKLRLKTNTSKLVCSQTDQKRLSFGF
jgi:hypothetical protein